MNLATGIAISAASFNLATAMLFLAIARAPGWRMTRLLAWIALTAALYSLCNAALSTDGLTDRGYGIADRLAYLIASFHCTAWLTYAFGTREGTLQPVPVPIRALVAAVWGAALLFTIVGLRLPTGISLVVVPWAGVTYHYPLIGSADKIFGFVLLALLALTFVRLALRLRQGEPVLRWQLVGFAVFFLCALDEVLVVNRQFTFLSLADVGVLCVVLPLSAHVVGRFLAGARRLDDLSNRLEAEVRERTAERDRAQTALVEAERLAALGRLAAGVGHEISNPLTYMQLALHEVESHLVASRAPPEIREALANTQEGAFRIQKVVEGLRGHSRSPEDHPPLDPREAVRSALKVATPRLRHVGRISTEFRKVPRVNVEESRLVEVLVNLLVNAAQALESRAADGSIVIRTETGPAGEALLTVADDGAGIPPEDLLRLGEPYFTTRAENGALGLGLFVSRGIINAHAGRLEFSSEVGKGTRVRVHLPAAEAEAHRVRPDDDHDGAEEAARSRSAVARGHGTRVAGGFETGPVSETERPALLLVDNEMIVLQELARFLRPSWDVACAPSAREASALLETRGFDAVVWDLMMPGMSGMEFAAELGQRDPALRLRTLFLVGDAVPLSAEPFLERPDVRSLKKPVDLGRLESLLREMVGQSVTRA